MRIPVDNWNLDIITNRCLRAGLPFAAALSLAAVLTAAPAHSATVACAKAAAQTEFAICNSESLQDLDLQLDKAYSKELQAAATAPQQQQLARDHASWVQDRNACKADMACIAMRYQERILDLEREAEARPAPAQGTGFKRFAAK